ncbi:hypothetical protein [Chlamydiifrater volucris]|uniref:hypothetical protein n=1 Tax=Chlamydiifrater volucris TaxID=2681470 RepID=UPI001BCDA687|nr:hypothetical protein [Chlamydiifrater volucris]
MNSARANPSTQSGVGLLEKGSKGVLDDEQKALSLIKRLCTSCLFISGSVLVLGIGGIINALVTGVVINAPTVLLVGVFSSLLFLAILGLIFVEFQIENRLRVSKEILYREKQEELCLPIAREPGDTIEAGVVPTGCSYIKEDVWEILRDSERLYYQSPLSCIEGASGERISWLSSVQEEFLGKNRVDSAIARRCQRELAFILLGFLSWEELEGINNLWEQAEDHRFYSEDKLYAECIKRYPNLVAAEGAYFAWIKQAFPYLSRAKSASFWDATRYRVSFFFHLNFFVKNCPEDSRRCFPILQCLSGWGPVCFSNFELGDIRRSNIRKLREKENWSWDFFCRKVSEFCRDAVFHEGGLGNWECFLEYVDYGVESSLSKKKKFSFFYEKADQGFFETPIPMWDLFSLCESDPMLVDKIDEGLSALENCGYLGEMSVKDIQDLEMTILGLK